jgi:hypothetical protein
MRRHRMHNNRQTHALTHACAHASPHRTSIHLANHLAHHIHSFMIGNAKPEWPIRPERSITSLEWTHGSNHHLQPSTTHCLGFASSLTQITIFREEDPSKERVRRRKSSNGEKGLFNETVTCNFQLVSVLKKGNASITRPISSSLDASSQPESQLSVDSNRNSRPELVAGQTR